MTEICRHCGTPIESGQLCGSCAEDERVEFEAFQRRECERLGVESIPYASTIVCLDCGEPLPKGWEENCPACLRREFDHLL